MSSTHQTRQSQKERTRRAILDAALSLTEEHGFAGLSLRQVTRESGIVPTAFYRHFATMEQLGLTLVEESFETLRQMLRDARRDPRTYQDIISRSAETIVSVVRSDHAHFAFIARERFGGVPAIRTEIRHQLDLFVRELALDLSRLPFVQEWPNEDVAMLSRLYVQHMVAVAEQVLESPVGRTDVEARILDEAKRQMRVIALGVSVWNPTTR